MSDRVEGIVAKITEKPTRNGGTIYNVCLEINGGEDEWFGHGFNEPEFQEGDEIEFDISYNGDYANVDTNTVNILSEGGGGSSSTSSRGNSRGSTSRSSSRSSSTGGSSSRAKPSRSNSRSSKPSVRAKPAADDTKMSKDDWQKKDNMIRRQACMNTAIALISSAVSNELVSLPTKKADKLDAYIALCDEEAVRLYDQYEEQVHGAPKKASRGRSSNADYDDDIPQ
jgi:hypothetical protein